MVDSSITYFGNGLEIRLIAIADSSISIPILLPYRRTFYVRIFAPGRYPVRADFYVNDRICSTADSAIVVSEPSVVEQSSSESGDASTVNLHPNHPNPFNPSTTILYELPRASQVEVTVFDLLGKRIRTLVQDRQPAGQHRLLWDGRDDSGANMPSGVYLYRLNAGAFVQTRKMLLVQ